MSSLKVKFLTFTYIYIYIYICLYLTQLCISSIPETPVPSTVLSEIVN